MGTTVGVTRLGLHRLEKSLLKVTKTGQLRRTVLGMRDCRKVTRSSLPNRCEGRVDRLLHPRL